MDLLVSFAVVVICFVFSFVVYAKSVDFAVIATKRLFLHIAYRYAERTDCVLQGFGAVFTLFGFIPLSTGYNHSGVKHSECFRNSAIGTGYNSCPPSNIHAECDAMRKGIAVLFKLLPSSLVGYVVEHCCVLYVASARSKARGISESFNPCTECATFAQSIGLKHLVGHNKQLEIVAWSGDKCYGGQAVPKLAPRYTL